MLEAEDLQDRVKQFAASNTAKREAQIDDLLDFAHGKITPYVMIKLIKRREPQQTFRTVAKLAASSRFLVNDQEVQPWTGGYTLLGLNGEGDFVAAFSHHRGGVYKKYTEEQLYYAALKKALVELHLTLDGRSEGLENEWNLNYLSDHGFRLGNNMFLGSASFPTTSGKEGVIGISGCTFNRLYLQRLVFTPLGTAYPIDYLAGRAEAEFAKTMVSYLVSPWQDRVRKEPLACRILYGSN